MIKAKLYRRWLFLGWSLVLNALFFFILLEIHLTGRHVVLIEPSPVIYLMEMAICLFGAAYAIKYSYITVCKAFGILFRLILRRF